MKQYTTPEQTAKLIELGFEKPKSIESHDGGTWLIVYICERDGRFKTERLDLINALYDMLIKLKEEGVI